MRNGVYIYMGGDENCDEICHISRLSKNRPRWTQVIMKSEALNTTLVQSSPNLDGNDPEKALADNNEPEKNPTSVVDDGSKLTPHEHVELVPRPSESPDDPLNWPSAKKNLILGVVIACSFLPDYGSVTGAATLVAQAV
jgi:hypothetical protein